MVGVAGESAWQREGFVGVLWSTRMGVRGQVFRSVGKVRYLCRVYLIYR